MTGQYMKKWFAAYLFLQFLSFRGFCTLCEKIVQGGDASRRIPVPTGKANYFHAYNTAQMKDAAHTYDSGLEGTTHWKVMSGVPGGPTTGGPGSIEFAIAPIENDKPSYSRSVFIKSDEQGKFRVSLPPGKYWLGPKDKALDPINYAPGSFFVSEELVVVKRGIFTKIDLFQVGYAP